MKNRLHVIIRALALLSMIVAGWMLYDQLPETMPVHWNFAGQPDGYGSRDVTVWTFPLITFGLMLLFWALPKIDPKREKYEKFLGVWNLIQTVLVLFFAYMYYISLIAGINPSINVGQWVVGGVGVMFVLMGNYMGKIRQNYFVGIKTPWTLNDEEVWNKTHRFGGWCFVIAGLIFLGSAIVGYFYLPLFVVAIVVAVLLPIVYSYVVSVGKKANG